MLPFMANPALPSDLLLVVCEEDYRCDRGDEESWPLGEGNCYLPWVATSSNAAWAAKAAGTDLAYDTDESRGEWTGHAGSPAAYVAGCSPGAGSSNDAEVTPLQQASVPDRGMDIYVRTGKQKVDGVAVPEQLNDLVRYCTVAERVGHGGFVWCSYRVGQKKKRCHPGSGSTLCTVSHAWARKHLVH